MKLKVIPKKKNNGNRLIDLHNAMKEHPLPKPPARNRKKPSGNNLINFSNVKKRMLEYSRSNRAGKYTRVSKSTLEAANRHLDAFCLKVVTDARGGKTL